MFTKCPQCSATSVAWEGYGSQEDDNGQKVCVECGTVLEEGSFQSSRSGGDGTTFFHTASSGHYTSGLANSTLPQTYLDGVRAVSDLTKIPRGLTVGFKKIKQLLHFLACQGKHTLQQSNELYEKIFMHPTIHHQTCHKKEIMAGCCLFYVCRNDNKPVTIEHFSLLLSCSPHLFHEQLRSLETSLNIKCSGADIEGIVDSICAEAKLSQKVSTLIKKMLPMLKDAWILEGRRPSCVIRAASYSAWLAEDFTNRKKVALKQFFSVRYNINKSTANCPHAKRHNEIVDMLITMASVIPWITPSDISRQMVFYHLEDIISYQKTLCQELRAHDEKEEHVKEDTTPQQNGMTVNKIPPTLNADNPDVEDSDTRPVADPDEPDPGNPAKAHRKRCAQWNGAQRPSPKNCKLRHGQGAADVDSGDRPYFLPPSFGKVNPPEQTVASPGLSEEQWSNLDSEEVSEKDLSVEELSQYIKSPEEILSMHKLNVLSGSRS